MFAMHFSISILLFDIVSHGIWNLDILMSKEKDSKGPLKVFQDDYKTMAMQGKNGRT